MKVFVTGATGFVTGNVTMNLVARGDEKTAQHLAEIDSPQRARQIDHDGAARRIDGAGEIDGPAVELAGEPGDLQHAVAQVRLQVGIAHLERSDGGGAGLERERGVERL